MVRLENLLRRLIASKRADKRKRQRGNGRESSNKDGGCLFGCESVSRTLPQLIGYRIKNQRHPTFTVALRHLYPGDTHLFTDFTQISPHYNSPHPSSSSTVKAIAVGWVNEWMRIRSKAALYCRWPVKPDAQALLSFWQVQYVNAPFCFSTTLARETPAQNREQTGSLRRYMIRTHEIYVLIAGLLHPYSVYFRSPIKADSCPLQKAGIGPTGLTTLHLYY